MTALTVSAPRTDASSIESVDAGTIDGDLLTLTLQVSEDQENWHPIVFRGENATYLDQQAVAYIQQRPYLTVQMDDSSTCLARFPRTFDAVFLGTTKKSRSSAKAKHPRQQRVLLYAL